jgi:hypothetical protein
MLKGPLSLTKEAISLFIKPGVNTSILKTEILSISITGGRFPRVVRVPPRSLRSLWGHTWTHFSRWSRRPSLQSN